MDEPPPVVADTRVEIRGQSDFGKPWGVSVSTGYNRVTDRLRKQLGGSVVARIKDKCKNTLTSDAETRVRKAADELRVALTKLNLEGMTVPTLVNKDVDRYVRELYVTWQNTKVTPQSGKEQQIKEAEAAAKKLYETTGSTLEGARGECIYKAYALERMTAAYSNGWAIRVEGSVDFFPYIEGPKVSPKEGEPAAEPVKHGIAGFGGAGSLIWFPSRSSRVSATVSYGAKRATPKIDAPQRRIGFLLETAHNYGIGDIDVSGFQRGIAFGGMFAMQRCLEDAGCNDPVPYYDGAMTARTLTIGGFIDVRAAEKLQLRVGLPFTIHTFASPPPNTEGGGLLAWSFAPTVALSTTQWTL
ncbi:hypothetical protein [Polyangium fumosum]|uniref:Uncharacterized protein n=1 Tax=Polyangium fumosum TaxID=889272 RepID=A0A4U1IVG7_9BACT|nr:hypothetical protein [Polyangium fumosum]TKC98451.1 hypothetical protein E8A74_41270 [Polyangium fumosum]